jgi:hypothetical protein
MMRSLAPGVTLLLLLAWTSPSEAQIYRWLDERGVTNYTEGLDSVPEKYRATAVPIGLQNAPKPAGGGPAAAGTSTMRTQIKFTPGKAIVVDVKLNGATTVKLLFDTGAQRTMVGPRALAAAGVSLNKGQAAMIRGATGTATVSTVQLDSLELGPLRIENIPVLAHDIEQEGIEGLLGRDVLDQFKVSIDNQDGLVTLSPK